MNSAKFNKTSLPGKEFYSKLSMEDIIDADYMRTKRVWRDFERKHFSEYHNLHVENDILHLANVFKNLNI